MRREDTLRRLWNLVETHSLNGRRCEPFCDFSGGPLEHWFMPVHPWAEASLAIQRTNGRPTQGSDFHFHEGAILYDATEPYTTDNPSRVLLQIVRSFPAIPRKDSTPRDPGSVRFDLYTLAASPAGFRRWTTVDCTMDEFVAFLIMGPPATWPEVIEAFVVARSSRKASPWTPGITEAS